MKKLVYSIALVALFNLTSKAQELKSGNTKQEPVKKEGATSETKKEEPKKAGTRMAINEKGLPGTKTNTKKESTKEAPKNQPGTTKE
ncbi:MAG: hypothetical protein SFY56_07355 [Bacteroidota bacterium]|nr:hypothetical protein [Bacteroidota bacterium]